MCIAAHHANVVITVIKDGDQISAHTNIPGMRIVVVMYKSDSEKESPTRCTLVESEAKEDLAYSIQLDLERRLDPASLRELLNNNQASEREEALAWQG